MFKSPQKKVNPLANVRTPLTNQGDRQELQKQKYWLIGTRQTLWIEVSIQQPVSNNITSDHNRKTELSEGSLHHINEQNSDDPGL